MESTRGLPGSRAVRGNRRRPSRNRSDSVFSCSNRAMKSDVIVALEKDTYVAGDVITGSVSVMLTQEVKIKDLVLRVYGHAKVSWDELRTYTKGSATSVSRRNTEHFFDHAINLLKKESEEGTLIPAGDHYFPFEFVLPPGVPATYEGKWGQIKYGVKSVLERPWKFDIEREKEFTVEAFTDLNEEPELVRPTSALGDFRAGFLCFHRGLVNIELRLSRRGFVLGDSIPFYVEIENNTSRKLYSARIALVQHVTFRIGKKLKKVTNILSSATKGEISSWNTDTWDNETLPIPPEAPPSTGKMLKSIQIKYTITLYISYSTWKDEYSLPVTIVLATRAFKKNVIQSYLTMLGYTVTPQTSPTTTPRMPRNFIDANGHLIITPPRGRSSSKPTLPTLSHDQPRMRRASAMPAMTFAPNNRDLDSPPEYNDLLLGISNPSIHANKTHHHHSSLSSLTNYRNNHQGAKCKPTTAQLSSNNAEDVDLAGVKHGQQKARTFPREQDICKRKRPGRRKSDETGTVMLGNHINKHSRRNVERSASLEEGKVDDDPFDSPSLREPSVKGSGILDVSAPPNLDAIEE